MGIALVFLLLQNNLGGLNIALDQLYCSLCVDVDAGDLVALADIAAQLTLINVIIRIIHITIVCNEGNSTVFQQILVHPVT